MRVPTIEGFLILLLCGLLPSNAVAQRNLQLGPTAPSEQRVALIIGNAAYVDAPLRNPANDAGDMAQALRDLGFAVTLRTNANQRSMKEAVRDFGNTLTRGGVGVFYFAGHGIQYRGRNFLVPVGANIQRESHIEDETVDAAFVLAQMEEARNRVNIVILDACRNNPFSRGFRSAARGLAQMDAAHGTLIAFATSPGATADDGQERNGIYTKHLLQHIRQPGIPVELMLKRVRDAVMEETKDRQTPWESSSLRGADFYFKIGAVASTFVSPPSPPQAPALDPLAVEVAFWESVKASTNPEEIRAYLDQYPQGRFSGLANARLKALQSPATQVVSVSPSLQPTRPPLAIGTVRIAVLGPMSFVQGENHWQGAELARDDINQAGGIDVGGRRLNIELIRVDTNEIQSVPNATMAVERAITRERADFLVGGFRSEAVLAMQEVAMDYKKLFLGVGAAHSKLGQNVEQNYNRYKYWFRVAPVKDVDLARTLFAALRAIGEQLRKELRTDNVKLAILAEKATWTEGLIAATQRTLPEMKIALVGTWQPSQTATDVTSELSAIERSGAHIVFTMLSGPVGITVGRQMGERKLKAIAFGINVEAQKDTFWDAVGSHAHHIATIDTYAEMQVTPKTIGFVRAFKSRFGKLPTYNAGTHDAIYLLKDAIERAGTTNPDKLVSVIETLTYVGTAGVIEFDKRHDPVWGLGKSTGIAVQWRQGQKVPFWPQLPGAQPLQRPF